MLKITIPAAEQWDEGRQEFVNISKDYTLQLEHSLVSLSKWESKWHKPFLGKDEKTREETIDYIRCMTITQNVPEEVYYNIDDETLTKISEYINDPMTATTFSERPGGRRGSNEIVTNEIIYHWMFTLNIPMKCEKWHLNHLLTQIRVCNIKNEPPKKMGKRTVMSRNAALNAARKQQLNTRG